MHDPFSARHVIDTPLGERTVYRIDALKDMGDIDALPYSIKVLLESVVRNHDGSVVRDEDVRVVVDLGGAPRNSPERRGLARRLKRLERGGLAVSMHAARRKLTPRG